MTLGKWLDKTQQFLDLVEEIRKCRRCSLWVTGQHKCPPYGDPNAEVMMVGEAPGRVDNPDLRGLPFVGNRSSDLLMEIAWELWPKGYDELFITNLVKCNPPQNRLPTQEEIQSCSCWLKKEIELVKPKIIVALGRTAANWFGIKESINTAKLKDYTWAEAQLVVLPHPAYILRNGPRAAEAYRGLFRLIKRRLNGTYK